MKIAVAGCGHGELDAIYDTVRETEEKVGEKVALLLICGDLQTIRDAHDLNSLAVPQKYRRLGDFKEYYEGRKKAPYLTVFIGGNHEASNCLWELYHGGWVAPNIYYLGIAGCIHVCGLKVAGLSGIFKGHDFWKGHFESYPYSEKTMRSIYHIRAYEIFRLSLLVNHKSPDVFLSHDWPQGIEHFGDISALLRKKPFFRSDIERNELGSPPAMHLLRTIRPAYWFSAHLHVRFAAIYHHVEDAGQSLQPPTAPAVNTDEILIADDDEEENEFSPADASMDTAVVNGNLSDKSPLVCNNTVDSGCEKNRETRFLALGKCAKYQQFLQVLDIPIADIGNNNALQSEIMLDRDWLAIVRATQHLFTRDVGQTPLPDFDSANFSAFSKAVEQERAWVEERVSSTNVQDLFGPFEKTSKGQKLNPQTLRFHEKLGISMPLA